MQITLSPCRGLPDDPETILFVAGDVLTVDGVAYDLASVPEGGEAIPDGDAHPFIGRITREGGLVHCTVRVLLGDDATPDQPDSPWVVVTLFGPVTIPAARIEQGIEQEAVE